MPTTKLQSILSAIALILALGVWVTYCHDPQIRKAALQGQQDQTDNRTIARLAAESFQAETVSRRAIAAADLRASRAGNRADSLADALLARPDTIYVRSDISRLVVAHRIERDSLKNTIAERDAAIFRLTASVANYRDTLVPRLETARDNWKRAASKPDYLLTDVAGGILAGIGLAKRDPTLVGAGAATISIPRLVHAVGDLLHLSARPSGSDLRGLHIAGPEMRMVAPFQGYWPKRGASGVDRPR